MSEGETPETLLLGDFLEKATKDLQGQSSSESAWSAADVWARGERYPQLAPALETIKKQFILESPDEAKNALLRALDRARGELPSQIKNTKPTQEGAAAVPGRVEFVKSITRSMNDERGKVRRAFAGQLARNFVKQTGVQVAEEKERAVREAIADHLHQQPITRGSAQKALIASIEKEPELAEIIKAKPDVINAVLQEEQPVLARIERIEEAIEKAALSAFDDPAPPPKPDVFLAIASEKATYTNEPVDRIVQQSAGLARAAAAVNADASGLGELTASGKFFQSFAKSGVAKAVAPAADALLDIVARTNPPAAKAFVESVIDRSLARITGNIERSTQSMIDRVGEAAAQSGFFQTTLKNWNQQIEQQRTAASGITKAKNVFDDFAGAIFGKSIDEGVFSYTELVQRRLVKGEQLPTWQQIHVVGIVQHQPHLIHFEPIGGAGGWALSWLSNTIAQKTGGKVASAVVGTAAKEAGKRATTAVLTKLGLSALIGAASGGTSLVVQAVAQGGLWLGGKIMGFAGFLFSGQWITNLLSSTGTSDWKKDQPLILAAGVIILLVALFLFPWFFNFNYMYDLVTKTPLAVNVQGKIGPGGGPGIDCEKTPEAPECKLTQCQGDCRWPLDVSTKFCISEGPFVGTHSRSRLSAVDFLTIGGQRSLFGANVYSQYTGTVERAVFGYPDDSGYPGNSDGGTYGNHVVVRTNNGGRLLFAHLRNIQTVREGENVPAGKVIGFVDHTGYSYDVHLHYENTSGDVNQFLPFPVPPCKSVNECDLKLKPTGHSACQ